MASADGSPALYANAFEDAVAAVKDFLAYQDDARATFEAMMAAAGDTTTALYSQVRQECLLRLYLTMYSAAERSTARPWR